MKIKKFPDGTIEIDVDTEELKDGQGVIKEVLRDNKGKGKNKKLLNENLKLNLNTNYSSLNNFILPIVSNRWVFTNNTV